MTFSELKKKDIICIGDGRLVGRACDLAIDPASGQTLGLIVCAGSCGFLRGEKNQMEIPWRQITCIGDDVNTRGCTRREAISSCRRDE